MFVLLALIVTDYRLIFENDISTEGEQVRMTFSSFTVTAYKIFIAVEQLHNLVIFSKQEQHESRAAEYLSKQTADR